jgi:curli biogenesis system outer membrane secretion channel CsgG
MRTFKTLATAVLAAVLVTATSLAAQEKKRVAVLDFNYATVQASVQAVFGTTQDIGKGITDLLIDKLVNDGQYRVIDRQAMAKILAEQNFSNSNRADPGTAAQIGKLLGVQVIIIGDITQFGSDDKSYGASGSGATIGGFGIGGLGMKKSKATVAITARMIDVNTGEILASSTGAGTSQRSGAMLGGGGSGSSSGGNGKLDMSSSNFANTIIGEAVRGAVKTLGESLDANAAKLPAVAMPARVPVAGLVADVSGNQLILNVGSAQGVHAGDTLAVSRVGRVIKDPATGRPLRSIDTPVGMVTVVSVDSSSAVGTFSGSGEVKVGDAVKSPN